MARAEWVCVSKAGAARLAGTILTTLLVATGGLWSGAGHTADAPKADQPGAVGAPFAIRWFAGLDKELAAQIADLAQPIEHVVGSRMTSPADIVKDRCGDLSPAVRDVLVDKIRALNPTIASGPNFAPGSTVWLPACVPSFPNTSVLVREGDSLVNLLEQYTGTQGAKDGRAATTSTSAAGLRSRL